MSSSDRRQRAARAEQMRKEREKADRRQRNLITVAIVAVVIVLVAVGGYAIKHAGGDGDGPVVAPTGVNKNFGFDYTAVDAGGTAGTNPVKVVLYEDFQCPVCKAFEAANGSFLDDQVKTGKITIEYRPFALLDQQSTTRYSTRAAAAGMCVYDKGGAKAFKKFHDLLYANQPPEGGDGLPASALVGFADQAGVPGLKSCVTSKKFEPWVVKAEKYWHDHGVNGTPTVVVNGRVVNGAGGANTTPQAADLQKAITAAS